MIKIVKMTTMLVFHQVHEKKLSKLMSQNVKILCLLCALYERDFTATCYAIYDRKQRILYRAYCKIVYQLSRPCYASLTASLIGYLHGKYIFEAEILD